MLRGYVFFVFNVCHYTVLIYRFFPIIVDSMCRVANELYTFFAVSGPSLSYLFCYRCGLLFTPESGWPPWGPTKDSACFELLRQNIPKGLYTKRHVGALDSYRGT